MEHLATIADHLTPFAKAALTVAALWVLGAALAGREDPSRRE